MNPFSIYGHRDDKTIIVGTFCYDEEQNVFILNY